MIEGHFQKKSEEEKSPSIKLYLLDLLILLK